MKTVIIIPAYNPDRKLIELVGRLSEIECRIIVVDDGSAPVYSSIFDKIKEFVVVIHHEVNWGKGAAIKTALRYIQERHPETERIGIMDADGQHRTEDMENLLSWQVRMPDALILGVRSIDKAMPLKSRIGNAITRFVFKVISGKSISDTQTGLRAFSMDLLPFMLNVAGDRYEYETNVLLSVVRAGIPVKEVPIQTIYHDQSNSCSHFRVVVDSFRIYKDMLKFIMSSLSSFVLDFVLFIMLQWFFRSSAEGTIAANIIARMISGYFNYYMNTEYVFHTSQNLQNGISYLILAAGTIIVNSFLLILYHQIAGIPIYQAKILAECTLFITSFCVQKFVIYRHQRLQIV